MQRELERAYAEPEVPLLHRNAYELLVAVALSAQCTDLRVNLVTPRLFELLPSVESMALAEHGLIKSCIASCGLSDGKARRLIGMAQMLMERHGGEVPESFAALEALPGVGHKTASVVMHQAFGHPAFPVDTHIYRLARRWGLSRGDNVLEVEADLKRAFKRSDWGVLHLQMVLWGREYCPARGCHPSCPICAQLSV